MTEFRASLFRGVLFHAASIVLIMSLPLVTAVISGQPRNQELWALLVCFGVVMVVILGLMRRKDVEEGFTVQITDDEVRGWDAGTAFRVGRTRVSIPLRDILWEQTLTGWSNSTLIVSCHGQRIIVEPFHFSPTQRQQIREALEAAYQRSSVRAVT